MLLAQRAKAPFKGVWSLPGGHVEWGETLRQAAYRELMEETSVEAELSTLVDVADVIYRDFLPEALANGIFRATPEPLVVGAGLETIQEALNIQKKGVSAKKIVVSLS